MNSTIMMRSAINRCAIKDALVRPSAGSNVKRAGGRERASCTRCIIGINCSSSTLSSTLPIINNSYHRSYFTNADQMKKTDPYHALGLEWGATTTEIKAAFRQKARTLHPDVNTEDTPEQALQKFQELQKAYSKLMDTKGSHRDDLAEEWSFAVWRSGDIIAQDRTDVAGQARKRPVKPAESIKSPNWGVASLGHPDGKSGNARKRGEYLTDGGKSGPKSSTVGTGQSKWVKPREFKPWNPDESKMVRANRDTSKQQSMETKE